MEFSTTCIDEKAAYCQLNPLRLQLPSRLSELTQAIAVAGRRSQASAVMVVCNHCPALSIHSVSLAGIAFA